MNDGRFSISFEDYAAIEAVNASMLNWYAKSPAYCRWMMDTEKKATKAMDLGNAVHFALLEPDRFAEQVTVFEHDGRTKDGKKEREEAAELGKIGLKRDEYDAALGMASSLYTHPRVRSLMDVEGVVLEESVIWTRPVTLQNGETRKVRCKARRDARGARWIADVKTSASLDRFSPWAVTDNGYYRQAAWYSEPDDVDHFFFFVVSTAPPHESAVFRLTDEALQFGKHENEKLLAEIAESTASGKWPRHVDKILAADIAPRY